MIGYSQEINAQELQAPEINYRDELKKARDIVKNLAMDGKNTFGWWEVCCGLVIIAEENTKDFNRGKVVENASLARELVGILKYLADYEHMENNVYEAASRMAKQICEHPRLYSELLSLQIEMLRCQEARTGHDLTLTEELCHELDFYRCNIEYADRGELDNIRSKGDAYLKHDPVEWTAEYEACVDEAEAKAYAELKDFPKGMGFCHAFWLAKARILKEDYGIVWNSLGGMNPGVMFD